MTEHTEPVLRQQKTDTPLAIPIHPKLWEAIEATSSTNMTFIATERGTPFKPASFGNWFGDCCREAGLKNRSAHGLKKTALTRLANYGATNQQLKAIGGNKSDSSLAVYIRDANQRRLALQALNVQLEAEREQNEAEDLSNLQIRVDNNAK